MFKMVAIKSMKFSFVVPIYNVEMYLDRCIMSLVEQTYDDYEVILVDDGSTDHSYNICESYASKYPQIKLYTKENGGLSDARNFGLSKATGEYIIFVDSDDYVDVTTCAALLSYTEQAPDIIRCNALKVENEEGLLRSVYRKNTTPCTGLMYLKEMMTNGQMPMAAWLNVYSLEFLLREQLEFKKGILHEDEQFTPRAFLKAQKVVDAPVVFYYYAIRENSITTQKDKRKNAKDMLSTCYELETIYAELTDEDLKKRLLDSLASKYLSIYQEGNLSRHGKEFLPKKFLRRNAYSSKTRLKFFLVSLSPRLYGYVHTLLTKKRDKNT